jgi:hypothetical protein
METSLRVRSASDDGPAAGAGAATGGGGGGNDGGGGAARINGRRRMNVLCPLQSPAVDAVEDGHVGVLVHVEHGDLARTSRRQIARNG